MELDQFVEQVAVAAEAAERGPALADDGIELRELRVYNFRHTWACDYLDTTGDIFGAALMLGTPVKMLQTRYFHMDLDKLHERFLAHHQRRVELAG